MTGMKTALTRGGATVEIVAPYSGISAGLMAVVLHVDKSLHLRRIDHVRRSLRPGGDASVARSVKTATRCTL